MRRVLGDIDHGALRLERRGKTVAHFFCAGSSVRSIGFLCDLSGTNASVAIFFAFLDLSGVEKDNIAQVGR